MLEVFVDFLKMECRTPKRNAIQEETGIIKMENNSNVCPVGLKSPSTLIWTKAASSEAGSSASTPVLTEALWLEARPRQRTLAARRASIGPL